MLRRYAIVALALTALAAGNALLWLARPTAEPVAPETVFVPPEPAPAVEPRETAPPEPEEPLQLSLEPWPAAPAGQAGDTAAPLRDEPRLELDLSPGTPTRSFITEDLRLLDPDHGTRGVSRGHWVSDRMRLRGALGYSEEAATQERDVAVGVGIDLAF